MDGPCHSWSFAAVAVGLALIVLYVGTAIAASIVSANGDGKAVVGILAYYVVVLGGSGLVARRAAGGGHPRCAVICRGALACLALHVFAVPFLAAMAM
jgi:tryptophan-rich sensory protein